ncbi:MAG TPA: hypothetical protein VGV18_07830, partial [Verrucomicrobiae bacterium]|nr:hypothetical protein [Verrucomicrobiae bacterium]
MVLLLACALAAISRTTVASPQLCPACPLNFFTNVASRLLSSQLNVDMDHIQIYPTNQYTPAVHRLLQVTANVLDATTTNDYPSVFRPLFWKTNEDSSGVWQTNIYIAGYQCVQEPLTANGPPIFSPPTDVTDPRVPFGLSGVTNNIYGFPWVIGVKKGLPNFNGLELDTCFFIERLLQFNRNNNTPDPGSTFPYGRIYTTNQMYVMGISNSLVMDDWNSYANNYQDPVTVVAQDDFSFGLSSDAQGFLPINSSFATNAAIFVAPGWPGTATSVTSSFVFPFGTNVCVMQNLSAPFNCPPSTNNVYAYFDGSVFPNTNVSGINFTAPCFIPSSLTPANFVNVGTPPLPHLVMQTTNRLQAYMLDTANPGGTYILDYIQLGDMDGSMDVNQAIADPDNTGLWSTNTAYNGGSPPFGVNEQFLVSSGMAFPPVDSDETSGNGAQVGWTQAPVPGAGSSAPAAQISYFRAFFSSINEDASSAFG